MVISPGFWFLLLNFTKVITEWIRLPLYFDQKFQSVFTGERLVSMGLMRWAEIEKVGWIRIFSKILYNRFDILIDEFFGFLAIFSPRIYFQAGDGSQFSPAIVEPIPFLLFPLFIFGIIKTVSVRPKVKWGYIFVAMTIYLSGVKNFSFLFPIFIYYLYLASKGFGMLNVRYKKYLLPLLIVYSLFVEGRIIWSII